jgi:hypothetical protein
MAGTGPAMTGIEQRRQNSKSFNIPPQMFRRTRCDETFLPSHETIFRFSRRRAETGNP